MEWYYAANKEKLGPVDETEIKRLADGGVVSVDTLVWHNSMKDWTPHAEVMSGATPAGIVCIECGKYFSEGEVIKLGSGYACAACKPVVVQRMQEGAGKRDDESVRKEYLYHEASVQSVGTLYYLGAGIMLLGGLVVMVAINEVPPPGWSGLIQAFICVVLVFIPIYAGSNLQKLSPSARLPVGLLSGLGLLAFPIGTLLNGYILYLVFGKKGT